MKLIEKFISLLPAHRMRQAPLVILLMIIGAGFEVLGVGLIIPFVELLSDNSDKHWIYKSAYFEGFGKEQLIFFFTITLALAYLIKGMFLSILAYVIGRFTYGTKSEISNDLMSSYISASYEFHIKNNTAQLIRNLTTESNALVAHALNPMLILVAELFVVGFVSLFLIWIEPLGTLTVLLSVAFLAITFHKLLSSYSRHLGNVRQKADGLVIQKSQEAFGGIKDVKVLGRELFFAKMFVKNNNESCNASGKQFFITQLPRLYLETIGVLAMLLLIYVIVTTRDDLSQVVPILSAFGLAAFRLLPSANRILSSLNALKFAEPVIENLVEQKNQFRGLDLPNKKPTIKNKNLKFDNSIDLINVCYKYPNSQQLSLNNLSISIAKGECIGIIGKSGAGKSTLSYLVSGLLIPLSGEVLVDGVNIQTDLDSWKKKIGYVQQEIFLIDDSIRKNIAFGNDDDEIDDEKINQVIAKSQLDEFVLSLDEGINTNLGERGVRLSGGQKQRIGIARALYRNCPILVFDEATSSLDNNTEAEIVSFVRNLKGSKTLIIITHRLSTIEYCDRIFEFDSGKFSEKMY